MAERAATEITIMVSDLRVHFPAGADVAYIAAIVGALRRSC